MKSPSQLVDIGGMGWTLIKSVLKHVLGWRTMLLAVLAAVAGGVGLAAVGVVLWRAALPDAAVRYTGSICLSVAIVYGAVGAIAALVSILLGAAGRAVGELRPLIRPAVGRCAAATVGRLPTTGAGVEIARLDAFILHLCDSMVLDLPGLLHVSRMASELAKWRLRKLIDPHLSPLRETGQMHVSVETLQTYATDACTSGLLELVREQVTRPRWVAYLAAVGLLLIPLCIACFHAVAGTLG